MAEGNAALTSEGLGGSWIDDHKNGGEYGLSPLQAGMVFHSLSAGHSGVYLQQLLIHWIESLDLDALEQAWEVLTERHDILRSAFRLTEEKELRQVFQERIEPPMRRLDWRKLSAAAQETRLQQLLAEDRAQEFSLNVAPLHRWISIQLGEDEYYFLWSSHHAIFDGRSRLLLLRELLTVHDEIRAGAQPATTPALSYSKYLTWLQTLDPSAAEGYWKRFFHGFASPTPLPLHTGDVAALAGVKLNLEETLRLSAARADSLRKFTVSTGLTLNTLVQGAWALLLSRYTGENDIVFGATRACRKSMLNGEAENMIGLFINTLPVRVKIDEEESVVWWLRDLRRQAMEIRPYEHTALSLVKKCCDLPAGASLFNSIIVFEGYDLKESLSDADPRWRRAELELFEQTSYPLTLSVKSGKNLILTIEYDPEHYEKQAIRRMLEHVETLLASMTTHPDGHLKDIELLTPAEYKQLIHTWNQTSVDWSAKGDVVAEVERHAAERPDATAVEAGNKTLTYAQLNVAANRLSHYLCERGVGRDVLIGVCFERSLELAISLLAVLKAGGAYVPLDPVNPVDRQQQMIEDAELALILTTRELGPGLPNAEGRIVELDQLYWELSDFSDENPRAAYSEEALAYQMYTSGSTGRPKGAMITRGGLKNHNYAVRDAYRLAPQDRVLQFSTICFDIAVEEIFPTWLTGATLVFRDENMSFSIQDFHRGVEDKRITVLNLPTAFWKEWAFAAAQHQMKTPETVRLVVVGGEKASIEAYAAWRNVARPGVHWINGYGPTECTVTSTIYDAPSEVVAAEIEIPIGRPTPNTSVYVLDSARRPVPVGVYGELYIGGAPVGRGYWRRPELSEAAFVQNPFLREPGARMYRTGDQVRYREDGNLEFRGRRDSQLKIGSYRVELGEIESALRRLPEIEDSVVTAQSQEGVEKQLVAYVKPTPDAAPFSVDEARRRLKSFLPPYMIPAVILIVEQFPRTLNGKIDVRALPSPSAPVQNGEDRALTPEEIRLQQIWWNLLRQPDIGVDDNFFALGGNSLLSLRLAAMFEKEFGKPLPLPVFFRNPTIRALARAAEARDAKPQSCLVLMQPDGSRAPFFCVHGAGGAVNWFNEFALAIGPDQPFYGIETPALASLETALAMSQTLTVPTLAETYVAAVRSVQPKGPYRLGGYSMGGIVAFEMAQQFIAAGETVSLLAILDADCPASILPKWKKLPVYLWRFLGMDVAAKKRFFADKWKYFKQVRSEKQAETSDEIVNHLDLVKSANERAAYSYRPSLYPGPILLLRSSQPHLTSPLSSDLGWGKFAEQGVNVHMIPGNHYALFLGKNLELISGHMRTALARGE